MSSDNLLELFTLEFNKLEKLVNEINTENELPVNQIVEVYYQITNVSSMISVMDSQHEKTNTISNGFLLNAQNFVAKNFNSIIHPKIMANIANSISTITENLQSLNSEPKSKETIENEAKLYEKLREIMSTKEFVKQYDSGLSND